MLSTYTTVIHSSPLQIAIKIKWQNQLLDKNINNFVFDNYT